jgi:iron(III) transport system substrate-binding protein
MRGLSRRDLIEAFAGLSLTAFAAPARAAAPPAEPITDALIAAAKKEGQVVWYTSADLRLAELIGKTFEQKFPGVSARVERLGAERIFTRIGQEYTAGIRAVDAVSNGDVAQFLTWKRQGWLAPYVPEGVAAHIPEAHRDPDGAFAIVRCSLCVIAYNSDLVKREEAPRSFADLLDPKWKGKIVKAHPAYSGTIITSTFQMVRELGWPYLEKLARQQVLQIQSATDTPNKVVIGERPVMADGNEYNVLMLRAAGKPIEPVYASEGTPPIYMPNAIFAAAPHPNAARLFHSWLFTREVQQMLVDVGALRSLHAQVKDPPGRTPLSAIKLWKDDPTTAEKESDEIKRRYAQIFKV